MKILTKEQVILLHNEIIKTTGGDNSIRDEGLLESALNAPFQSFGEQECYPSIIQKGTRLGFGLISNHAFVDGNKRIGLHAMLIFFELNHIQLAYTQDELEEMTLNVASKQFSYKDMLEWVIKHQI